jgi:cytochrome c biogenesis protein CcmG/thiol:disulfide interchange protein DsbE
VNRFVIPAIVFVALAVVLFIGVVPMLMEIARENRVPLIGLNWRDDDREAMRWIERHGDPYAVIIVDQEGRTAIDFGVYGAPETFFIDGEGRVQYRHVGAMTREVWEREFVSRLPRGALP